MPFFQGVQVNMELSTAKINTNLCNSHDGNAAKQGINGRKVQRLVEARAPSAAVPQIEDCGAMSETQHPVGIAGRVHRGRWQPERQLSRFTVNCLDVQRRHKPLWHRFQCVSLGRDRNCSERACGQNSAEHFCTPITTERIILHADLHVCAENCYGPELCSESLGLPGGGCIRVLKINTERLSATGCSHADETELVIAQGDGHDPSTDELG